MPAHDYSHDYDPDTDVDRWYTVATARRIAEALVPNERVLEMGCATGLMSAQLSESGVRIVGVERSVAYFDRAQAREIDGAEFICGDVESVQLDEPFDHVVATNLLHELADPAAFLKHCWECLVPGGHIHLTLQNPESLHRLLAQDMGLIDDLYALSERGLRYGSSGLISRADLAELARAAGFEVARERPVMLKPFSNAQLADLDDAVMWGLIRCADRFPDNGAMNYLQATKPST